MAIPSKPKQYFTYYEGLKGADFSCDPTECDRRRSPDLKNMISDSGGNPVKRVGWRVINTLNCGKILKLFFNNGIKYVVSTTGIYTIDASGTVAHPVNKTITEAEIFVFNSEVYAFADGFYKLGTTVTNVCDSPYVPEIVISRKPDGTDGTAYDSINLLTPKRKVSFLGDNTSTVYRFMPQKDTDDDMYKYVVADSIKVEVQNSNGIFEETTAFTKPTTTQITALGRDGVAKSFNVCEPYITFTSAHAPVVVGQDNVRITYENFDNSNYVLNGTTYIKGQYKEGYTDFLKCHIAKTYGYSSIDRVFCAIGNKVYYSEVNKPDYFPDDNYMIVGHTGKIMGLHRVSEYLAVIKSDSAVESTVFLISGGTYDNNTYFGVKPTIAGIGAISGNSFATLVDEPLFLNKTGIYAITNSYTTTEKILRNRSAFVDKRLSAEPNLENATAIIWNRYYVLCVNSHCYLLDGRQVASDRHNNTDYLYEAYYWENVPATAFYEADNELWFGTEEGKLCKFNTDIDNATAYCDNGTETDGVISGGQVIEAVWTTPLDDDGRPQMYKNLNKKGTVITLIPYERSSINVLLSKDGDTPLFIGSAQLDIFTWNLIDFERFTFNSNRNTADVYTNKKMKKYKRLQFVLENKGLYEPFGITKIAKTYTVGNYAK